ncbi:MAG: AHH domain-containing protein [Tannerella sp.]|nr:AHH domain-containing protein [Tannerella sp.]
MKRVVRPNEKWTDYDYDGTGNVIRETQYDGKVTLYNYDEDGLLKQAENARNDGEETDKNALTFKRDRAGRITAETQGSHTVNRVYDKDGNLIQTTSSLGADIKYDHDDEGNLLKMESTTWTAEWQRDNTGLELHRKMSGGIELRTQRDSFGREIKKSIGVRNVEQTSKRYHWGIGNRLMMTEDDRTGRITRYNYDEFDNLIKADYEQVGKQEVETIYRVPDRIGNLFETKDRTDRKYGKGGRLIEAPIYYYHYDDEGYLIFKEFKKIQGQGFYVWNKKLLKEKYQIEAKGTMSGWLYEWDSSGMLKKVINPQQGKISFGYDALGRRTYKKVKNRRTKWLWDGNVPLHEWTEVEEEPRIDLVTWVFEEGSFVPCARLTETSKESIVTDYLGTPTQMYDDEGKKTWSAELDIYGRVRTFDGRSLKDCPFRYQGQYEDAETGLYYNRFRYYSPEMGSYISKDPIGLNGGMQLYNYVHDPNGWIDRFGLARGPKTGAYKDLPDIKDHTKHHIIPDALRDHPLLKELDYDINNSRNIVYLPHTSEIDLTRTVHPKHGGHVAKHKTDALTELDRIHAMDASPEIKRMHVDAYTDDMRSKYLKKDPDVKLTKCH